MAPSTQPEPSCNRRQWLRPLLVLLVLAAVSGVIAFLFRERVLDEWRLW